MFEKITSILVKYTEYPLEAMKEDTSLMTDIAINSLDYVKVIMELEDEFDIEVPENMISQINTIGELTEYIQELVEEA